MREDLLHFIWKYKKLPLVDLATSDSETVSIVDFGTHNQLSGPDFFNAQISIDGQLWAGNVEIHVQSSDWYAHKHEKDSNYDNVILHVVWEHNIKVYRRDGSIIPTIALKKYVSQNLLQAYQILFDNTKKNFVNCEESISDVDEFLMQNWLERLYFERLEQKSEFVHQLLKKTENDWEQVLFSLLLKNFGLKINGEAFLSLSNALDFNLIRKLQSDISLLEGIFFGMSHLLDDKTVVDKHYILLRKEYQYLKSKFSLNSKSVIKPDFFKLRPPNFPTIRLSQLANLYHIHQNLFDKIIKAKTIEALYQLFEVSASSYWNTHFTFGKSSKKSTKKLTKKFIDLLIINSVLPIKFCFHKQMGKNEDEGILRIISKIKSEENSIISNFKNYGLIAENAKSSQAMLQLYNEYCTKNKCLQCAVGSTLLHGND